MNNCCSSSLKCLDDTCRCDKKKNDFNYIYDEFTGCRKYSSLYVCTYSWGSLRRLQSSPFFLSQPANDAREATGVRCAAARDWRKGREEKSLARPRISHLSPPVRRSLVGRENLQSILFAAAFVHETSEYASIPSTLSRKWEKNKKLFIMLVTNKSMIV